MCNEQYLVGLQGKDEEKSFYSIGREMKCKTDYVLLMW